ncbi:helix-turn-helix transcriptional regulator [Facklamia hominis]|uniref:helix-turn-helix transcriptional regulator n=1 Tax=Facklamia hominis TaxID=178214 RepID=UPI00288B2E09|nr:helix-turn-helix transcriptional regulator [Facklamia hominis]WPJ90549.1 helix-turn-helix transcriptional regulator [Facklamia hominis]
MLAEKIYQLRKAKNWSQEDLAAKIGVSRQSVSKWERGEALPDLERMISLSDIFGVSIDDLIRSNKITEDEKEDLQSQAKTTTPQTDQETPLTSPNEIDLASAQAYLQVKQVTSQSNAAACFLIIIGSGSFFALQMMADELPTAFWLQIIAWVILLASMAIASASFMQNQQLSEKYRWIETQPHQLGFQVQEILERDQRANREIWQKQTITGTSLCILSALPLVITSSILDDDLPIAISLLATIALISAGVYQLMRSADLKKGYQILLQGPQASTRWGQSSDDDPEFKKDPIWTHVQNSYWGLVLVSYLTISFVFRAWAWSWILFVIAPFLFDLVQLLYRHYRKK